MGAIADYGCTCLRNGQSRAVWVHVSVVGGDLCLRYLSFLSPCSSTYYSYCSHHSLGPLPPRPTRYEPRCRLSYYNRGDRCIPAGAGLWRLPFCLAGEPSTVAVQPELPRGGFAPPQEVAGRAAKKLRASPAPKGNGEWTRSLDCY